MGKSDLSDLIRQMKDEIKIFESLDDRELEDVIPCCESIRYEKGEVVFREDDPGEFMGFVVSGKLEVKKETEFQDKQIIIALLGKGSFVGEQSLFNHQLRSATVTAAEDTEMVILRRDAFKKLIQDSPQTAIKILQEIIRILAIRLRKATERLTTIF